MGLRDWVVILVKFCDFAKVRGKKSNNLIIDLKHLKLNFTYSENVESITFSVTKSIPNTIRLCRWFQKLFKVFLDTL